MMSSRIAAMLGVVSLMLVAPAVQAADRTWTGGGADNNWSTGANWGGTAPVNNDNLIFSGTTRQNSTNDISSLTAGFICFSNGGFTLNGNPLVLNPTSSGVFTNLAGINTLALDLNITPANKIWNIATGSELRLAGAVTNAAGANPLIILNGGGALRITSSNFRTTRLITVTNGAVIMDGGFADASNDGFRFVPGAGQTAACYITNNGVMRIGGGGNFRMGFTASASGSSSVTRIDSGKIEQYPTATGAGNFNVGEVAGATATFTQNGGLVWGNPVNLPADANSCRLVFGLSSATASGTYNLNGGTLAVRRVVQATAGATAMFNFNGGTLMPVQSDATFFQGVQTANVQNGGAVIDSTNFDITIGQNLQAAGTGGLTKLGVGTLVLSGTNSYTGNTVVSNGTLNVNGQFDGTGLVNVEGGILGGTGMIAGPVAVQAAATLSPGASVGTLTLQSNLTLAGSVLLEVDKSLAASNDLVQVSGLLANAGVATVTISNLGPVFVVGDSFKFFSKAMSNGAAVAISPATPGAGMAWTNKLAVDGTIGIVGAPLVGTAADLTGLTLSAGALSPAFNSNILSYTALVAYTNSTITISPVAANSSATIRVIHGAATNAVVSGSTSGPILLLAGANIVGVSVTAPDDSITRDYFVTITRTPPNVVVVLMDDLGFSDLGCYGGEIPTPNLDGLAAGGLRFRQFYNTARCSTTRCSMLTGAYSHQVAVDPSQALPNLREDNNVTIAELLGANGYRTYLAGKWHLGGGARAPEARGFQHVWRFANAGAHSADCWNTNQYTLISQNNELTNRIYASGQFYQADGLGDYSVDFLNHHQAQGDGKPFLLYMAFGAPHFPIQAPKPWVDTNAPVYAAGWDNVRSQRYTNMLARGVIDARHLLSPRGGTAAHQAEPIEEIPAWDTLAADRQADLARRMAIYAAMTQKLDQNVGRVVELLRQQGQLDNTLIMIMSDNGGNHEGGRFGQTGGTVNAAPLTGSELDNMGLSGQADIHTGGGWANVNNTPFRISKHYNHEGGIRSPLIVHWPQGVTRTNQWSDQSGHLIDIMATIVDATGVSFPTQFNSHVVVPLEGMSLKSQFTTTNSVARTLGFEHEGNRAWFDGDWKLVTKNFTTYDGSSPANELELYNLGSDPVEITNLASLHPTLTTQMATNWNAWAARVGVPSSRFITITTNTPASDPVPDAGDLLLDTFARPNATDIDASSSGLSGSRVPPLGTNAAYYEGWEGSGSASSIQVLTSNLQMAVGVGMSENGLMHNFTGQDIIDAGGFSVEVGIQSINTTATETADRFVGFGVGLSQAEAATGWDINNAISGGAVAFRGSTTGNTGVSDFFVELDLNGNVKVWRNGALLDTIPVGQNTGTLTASFELAGFSTNDTVTVKVFFNGQQVDIDTANANSMSRTFTWDRNDSNYIGLSARASNYTQMDNLAIRKLPLANGMVIGYALRHGLSGNDTAPGADPEGDGVSNFGEWAFGGDPAAMDSFIASLKASLVTPGNNFQFEFQRLQNYATVGLQFRYFVSDNLNTWTETTPTLIFSDPNEDNPGYEVVTMQLPPSATAGKSKLFLRVLAE